MTNLTTTIDDWTIGCVPANVHRVAANVDIVGCEWHSHIPILGDYLQGDVRISRGDVGCGSSQGRQHIVNSLRLGHITGRIDSSIVVDAYAASPC